MKPPYLMVVAAAACPTATVSQTTPSPAAHAGAEGGRPPYTAADVRFMAGMIGHHAQAVLMAGWAPSHGASPAVRGLCGRLGGWTGKHTSGLPSPPPLRMPPLPWKKKDAYI